MGKSWAVALLAGTTIALACAGTATAQLRVGPEVDLSDAGPGSALTLSYDSKRGGWLAFWFDWYDLAEEPDTPQLISRYISPDLRPKHDANSEFDAGVPVTAAYDPVADEHLVASSGTNYGSTGYIRRFSPTGALTGGPWRLEEGGMLPSLAVDPRTGTGIVVYIAEPEFDEGTTVWAQRLAPGGGLQGAPIRLSELSTAKVDLHRAAVAFNPVRNEFAVAWRERRPGVGGYIGDIVMTRLPTTTGGSVGMPVAISDSRTPIIAQGTPNDPDGAGAPGLAFEAATGGYLATWLGERGDVLEGPTQVYGQRLDGELRETGPDDFRISAGPGLVDFDSFPTVVANDGMMVVWVRWIGDEPQIVGRRVTEGPPTEPALLWTDGVASSPELAGPAGGPLLLGTSVDFASSAQDHPQVRRVGDGADPGSARIVSGPPSTSPSRSATFGLEPGRADGTIQCRLDEDAWRTCDRSHALSDLPDDPHRLQARAVGPDGWVQVDPTAAEWRVEAAPPDTRITRAPEPDLPYGSFGFEADELSDFECRLDDGAWERCGFRERRSSDSVNNLADGPHRYEVRAVDDPGRTDPSPALWLWTVDTTAPNTWVDDGPTGYTLPPGTFTFHSDDQGATFQCADADEGSAVTWSPCESGVPFPTRRGVFRVRAVDAVGNFDPSPARWEWRPETATGLRLDIDTAAGTTFSTRDATATFHAANGDGPGAIYECRLDGGAWDRCASPHRMENLADGAHALQVKVTTRAGVTTAVSELPFSVDTRRPETFVLAKPRSRTLLRTARIEFGATKPATFTCVVDGASRPCSSPLVLENLTTGHHRVQINATGTGGWTEPSGTYVDWTVETTDPNAPASARTRRSARAAAPPNTYWVTRPPTSSRSPNASFEWEWHDEDDVVASECKLDAGDWTACETPYFVQGLADGSHHFEVRNVASDGQRDPTPATHDWTIDNTTAHVVGQRAPSPRTNAQVVTIEFTADREGATFECRPADGEFQPCTSPWTATGQPEGAYRLIIRAVNRGKIGPARVVDWIIDRTPADTVLSAPRVSPGMVTNRRDLEFKWRATGHAAEQQSDGVVNYVEDEFYTVQCRVDGGAWNYCANLEPLKNLADGPHVLEAVVSDQAGNVDPTPARLEWTVDTGAADTFIDAGPAATVQTRTATFGLRAQPARDGFECRLDAGPWRACPATHTVTGVPDGSHTLEVRATSGGSPDASPARWLWTVDAEPTPSVVSGPPARTSDSTARFRLAADDASARIECRLDAGAWQTCGAEPSFPALADGDHALEVRAVDGGGRTGVLAQPWRWSVDTRVPDTLLDSAPEPLRRWPDAEFAFRSDESGTRFQCRLDGAAWVTCRSPHVVGGVSDGAHTLDVRAIDATGNTDASPVSTSWRVDTVKPFATLTTSPLFGGITKRTSATFTATANEPASVVECRVDEGPWVGCRDGALFSGFTEGRHRADVRVVDEAGNAWYGDGVKNWTTNGRAVDTELLRRPPRILQQAQESTFQFSGDGFSFVCSLDGGAWQTCFSPRTYSFYVPGHHAFEVAAVDFDGDRDATPVRWEWDVDPAPETTILEGPPANTTDRSARFVFTSNQPGSTFRCRLDSGPYLPCNSPYTVTGLTLTWHQMLISATGPNGHDDPGDAQWIWTVKAAAPSAARAAPQVARGAADAFSSALAGPRWRRILSGRRSVAVAGAPRELVVRVRSRGRVVAGAKVRITRTGTRRVALKPLRRVRRGARVAVSATWRPANGAQQTARLTTRVRR